mgnify:CR=1 FL=1
MCKSMTIFLSKEWEQSRKFHSYHHCFSLTLDLVSFSFSFFVGQKQKQNKKMWTTVNSICLFLSLYWAKLDTQMFFFCFVEMKMKATLKCLLLLPLLLLLKDKTRDHICIELSLRFFLNLKWIKKKFKKIFSAFFEKWRVDNNNDNR